MEFAHKHVLIVGAKRSGLAAAALLRRQGFTQIRVMDSQALAPEEQAQFAELGAEVVPQNAASVTVSGVHPNLIVLSPGVPADLALLSEARTRGVPVIGEVELASYFLQGPVIGITGSNGKTTTTALTGHLLKESGIECQVGGNIGTAVTSLVEKSHPGQWNVLELSSFQLETTERFRAHIAACLNITPDHLDRHHTLENYVGAKRKLFETQIPSDFAVLNYDDPVCREFANATKGNVYWFSASQAVPEGIAIQREELLYNGEAFMGLSDIKLRGLHNVENVMAACLMAHLAGAPLSGLGEATAKFPGVEHRIEFVRELDGVEYYNDSKATNVDAALKAITAFRGGLWVILGGKDKGSDYSPLREPLEQRGKAVLLIGADPPYPYAAAPLIRKALDNALPLVECGELESAVKYVREHAKSGDTVLLTPACASFDQYQNYEERGRRFKQIVKELF